MCQMSEPAMANCLFNSNKNNNNNLMPDFIILGYTIGAIM